MTGTEIATYNMSALDEITGAKAQRGAQMPVLKVNMHDEDASGRTIKKGLFTVSGTDDEPLYAENVTIRPLTNLIQWMAFDSETNTIAGKTILIPNYRVEPIDTLGTVKLGKPPAKVFDKLSKDEQARFKDIKAYRVVYCIVTIEGVTADGTPGRLETGAVLRLKGESFMPFEDEFTKKLPGNRAIYDYELKLWAEKKKNGTVTYFVVHYEPDFTKPLPMTEKVYETLEAVAQIVKRENEGVRKKYDSACAGRADEEDAGALVDDLSSDFDEAA